MRAGAEFINDSGSVKIDDTWANYALIQKSEQVSSNISFSRGLNGISLTLDNFSDLVFVHCTSGFGLAGSISEAGGARRLVIATRNGNGVPVTCYVFRRQPPTPSTMGLQIYGEDGLLTFDMNSKFCRVAGFYPASIPNQKAPLTAGKTYAMLIPTYVGVDSTDVVSVGGREYIVITNFSCRQFSCASDGVSFGDNFSWTGWQEIIDAPVPPQSSSYSYVGGPICVADVTGF